MRKKGTSKRASPRVKTPVELSCQLMCQNLKHILGETLGCGVPLGINVESVSGYRDEINATHDLFRDLQVSHRVATVPSPWSC